MDARPAADRENSKTQSSAPPAMEPTDSESGPPSRGRLRSRLVALAIYSLGLLVVANGSVALYAFHRLHELRQSTSDRLWRSEARFQSLESQLRYDSTRRHLLLGIRDEILRTEPELDLSTAYSYAKLAVDASETHRGVDPLLLVAIGAVGSGFDTQAISRSGARGLYRIHPTTGRTLSMALGWNYSDEMLHEPPVNTKLAAVQLQILSAAHDDVEALLIEYDEGSMNRGYYRAKSGEIVRENEEFVSRALEVYDRLRASLYGDSSFAVTERRRGPRHDREAITLADASSKPEKNPTSAEE